MSSIKKHSKKFSATFSNIKEKVAGEGLNASLLDSECDAVEPVNSSAHSSLITDQPVTPDYDHADHLSNRERRAEGKSSDAHGWGMAISLSDVMRHVPHGRAGVVSLEGGGAEAVPTIRGEDVKAALRSAGFNSLVQLIPVAAPRCGAFAVASADGSRAAATHLQLRALLERENFSRFGIYRNDRCAVLLENGPEMACAVMLCLARCTCVPINMQQTLREIRSELKGTSCKALIVHSDHDAHHLGELVEDLDVLVLKLSPDANIAGLFSLSMHNNFTGRSVEKRAISNAAFNDAADIGGYNEHMDIALVLHTSGTSGKKKLVPYTLETLCVGAACIMDSWALTPKDVCLNMMPLFHVGGITRNILAAILAGGGVVCAPAFDPAIFWQVIETHSRDPVTWYYAGPTMHNVIIEELVLRRKSGACTLQPQLRMVANASGGLIASLAERIQTEFGCVVLPSYGMTECMPISSPSCDYKLDHPNSSGQMCGPAVRILDDDGKALAPREIGNIALKGSPLMEGYLNDEEANRLAFFPGGWFNTGDMGYIDDNGWIYLTGRSKEVINRGGEIISPFEIEEAIAGHERVKAVLAFSVPHDILQEVVGVAIVSDPARPRVDLAGILKHVAPSLHPSKWPQVLVYMDELPKGQANKVQRIGLAQRLGLGALVDKDSQMKRMFEARCPPHGSSLQVPVDKQPICLDLQEVMAAIKTIQHHLAIAQCVVVSAKEQDLGACVVYVTPRSVDSDGMMARLSGLLHDYLMPKHIILMDEIPDDYHALPPPTFESQDKGYVAARTKTEQVIQTIWEQVLEKDHIGVESDFFEVGGSSLLAGRLIAHVRRSLGVALTAASVFSNRTIAQLATTCDAILQQSRPKGEDAVFLPERTEGYPRWIDRVKHHERLSETADGWVTSGFEGMSKDPRLKPYSQLAPSALICQALPLLLLYPLRRICTWLFFITIWLFFQQQYIPVSNSYINGTMVMACNGTCSCPIINNATHNRTVIPTPTCSNNSGACSCKMIDRLSSLVLALLLGRLVSSVVFPLLGIITKWLVIGRYRTGRYAMWSQYYLRWWYVDQVLMICGRGIFRHNAYLLNLYYRMMGAAIGPRVVIDPRAKVAEFDLITIGADTAVDNIRLRAFCVDNGCMVLAPVKLGSNVSIATKVYLAPGLEVPDGAAMGPNSSSYDLNPFTTAQENRRFCKGRFAKPMGAWRVAANLIILLVFLVEQLPVLFVLQQMVLYPWYLKHLRGYRDVLMWFLTPGRIAFYIALRVVRSTVCPLLRLIAVLIVKRFIIGKFQAGPWPKSHRAIWNRWLMEQLLPGEKLQEVGNLIGSHYAYMTYVLRLLGAKVGERIYWPGSNFEGLVEYDLLEVEDDVVFGSRSSILCADALEAAPIRIQSGANVSDRCVLLPGCTIGRNATMGSGSLCSRGTAYPGTLMHALNTALS